MEILHIWEDTEPANMPFLLQMDLLDYQLGYFTD